jgi:hypothetical protein
MDNNTKDVIITAMGLITIIAIYYFMYGRNDEDNEN